MQVPEENRMKREDLRRPEDPKKVLQLCHTRLHAAGAATEEEDLTLDMVRILVAKAWDERNSGPLRFVARADDAAAVVGGRVRSLFAEAAEAHPGVFRPDEHITVRDAAILAVALVLAPLRLLPGADDDGDLLGHAYEVYTATSMKRRRGQFFTNRLVVDLLTELVNPGPDDVVVDPSGGSGGFVTGALRWVRQHTSSPPVLALGDISPRLAKIAQVSLMLSGAPNATVCQGDGLAEQPAPGLPALGTATVVLTNPPFAGTGEGRLSDASVLRRFALGHRWTRGPAGLVPDARLRSDGAPPEMLFFERCLRWLAPGGRLGIVLPKSVLETVAWAPARALLFEFAEVQAVVTCHRNTFQPHTGVLTALVVATRRATPNPTRRPLSTDPPIFFAISRAAGQDSEGLPVYRPKPGPSGGRVLEEDLSAVAADWRGFVAGDWTPSEYRFSRPADCLDDRLNLSPQAHRPSLRAREGALSALDSRPGWSVSPLSEVCPGTAVFKGARLRSDRLLVAPDAVGDAIEPYYTPSAVLQGRRDAAKRLDLSRASPKQHGVLEGLRVRRGDLVVTRSGTVGKVAIIPAAFDRAIVSDDLIRVRVPDERLRLYLWAWLCSSAGQDQLKRHEYGSIQQHVEPDHVARLLVAMPDDPTVIDAIVEARRSLLDAREAADAAEHRSDAAVEALLATLATPGTV